MLFFDNSLYLEITDAVKCGLGSENYIYKEKSRGAKWANFTKHPVFKNILLIDFESLHPNKKKLVTDFFGNPYDFISKEPIRKMVVRDMKAEAFYLEYVCDDKKKLPSDIVEKYTVAASWLNMLVKAQDDFKIIKKDLNLSAARFWLNIGEMITNENIDLPANYKRLREKIAAYRDHNYPVLIHKQFGNGNSKKVDDEVSESLLLELISQPNTDDYKVCNQYNNWALNAGKEQISISTVGVWRRRHDNLVRLSRHGNANNYNTYGKHIPRKRPSAPLVLLEHDDNELDLFFQSRGKSGKGAQVYYFNRFVIAVVLDAFNNYPIGWAIAETYTKDLIKFAYLDAITHVKELTGGYYLPNQIRSDRFGLDPNLENDLAKFYQSLSIFTPAAVKVPRGKYIEQSFGGKWHQVLSCYNNYNGNNVTAKTKISPEFIDANKKNYPTVEQAPSQVFQFIEVLRHLVNEESGLSRQEEWIKAFHESDKSKAHQITDMQFLTKLGIPHTHTNKITNRGITPAINCVERMYEVPEAIYLDTVGKTVQVIYDPFDYSRILVTDFANINFVAREQELMPSAIADFEPGDRAKINSRLAEKVRHMQYISDKKQTRKDVLERNQIDIRGLLKAGIRTKAENHDALIGYQPVPLENKGSKRIPKGGRSLEDMINQM